MISDFVKGKAQYDYPEQVQQGIRLHRFIDDFTDHHAATQEVKKIFRPAYRLYAGAFADVVYDYFLANDSNEFESPDDLFLFSQRTYSILTENSQWLGSRFGKMFPYMKEQNWLYNYRLESGLMKSFNGLMHRSAHIKETDTAFALFENHKQEINLLYNEFFPDVKKACKAYVRPWL